MSDFLMNMIPRYDTREQIEVVRFQEPKPSMFRSSFFTGADVYSPTETIEWDEVREGASMARYVDENLEVEATEREPFTTHEITTPRVQEKRVLGVKELKRRLPGENPYSTMTPAERAQDFIDGDYAFCMDSIDRRVEQQCSQMMVTGRVDIIGKGVNTYVDYNLPLRLTLSGTDRWDQANPFETLQMMSRTLRKRNYNPTMVVVELSVAQIFIQNFEIWKTWLDIRSADIGQVAPGPVTNIFDAAQFFGQIKWPGIGILDLYTYDGTYKNAEGKETPYLDTGRILMLSAEATQNRLMYGAETIIDQETEQWMTVEGRYVPQFFVDVRARTQTVMVTSRPLPAPFMSDSWWTAKVL